MFHFGLSFYLFFSFVLTASAVIAKFWRLRGVAIFYVLALCLEAVLTFSRVPFDLSFVFSWFVGFTLAWWAFAAPGALIGLLISGFRNRATHRDRVGTRVSAFIAVALVPIFFVGAIFLLVIKFGGDDTLLWAWAMGGWAMLIPVFGLSCLGGLLTWVLLRAVVLRGS
jgi:hypothetical protein